MGQKDTINIEYSTDVTVTVPAYMVTEKYINDNLIMSVIRKVLSKNMLPTDNYVVQGITTSLTKKKKRVFSKSTVKYIHNDYRTTEINITISLKIDCSGN